MTGWAQAALDRLDAGTPVALATICSAEGSTPRKAGVRMVITPEGQWGTIGGGNLEFQAIGQARKLLDTDGPAFTVQDFPLGPILHQCCGGYIRLLLERLDEASRPWLFETAKAQAAGAALTIVGGVADGRLVRAPVDARPAAGGGPIQFTGPDGSPKNERRPKLDEGDGLVDRVSTPRPPVYLFGAGHVGQALVPVLRPCGLDLHWVDARADLLPPSETDLTVHPADDPLVVAQAAPAGAAYLVFTHSHDLDYRLTERILTRGDAVYCGLIGSTTKRDRFLRRLREAGLSQDRIDRLTCPIGAAGPDAKAPAVIAVAVAAELLRVLNHDPD